MLEMTKKKSIVYLQVFGVLTKSDFTSVSLTSTKCLCVDNANNYWYYPHTNTIQWIEQDRKHYICKLFELFLSYLGPSKKVF